MYRFQNSITDPNSGRRDVATTASEIVAIGSATSIALPVALEAGPAAAAVAGKVTSFVSENLILSAASVAGIKAGVKSIVEGDTPSQVAIETTGAAVKEAKAVVLKKSPLAVMLSGFTTDTVTNVASASAGDEKVNVKKEIISAAFGAVKLPVFDQPKKKSEKDEEFKDKEK